MVDKNGIRTEGLFEVKKLLKVKTKKATRYYNFDDNLHRNNDLPAVIWSDGRQWWYQNGKRHRDNNLPASIYSHGYKEWWVNGGFIRYETT